MSRFQTTRWSLIAAARDHPSHAREALEQLCRAYRPPVLAFVRSSGYSAEDAEDITQAFFVRFLERGWYAGADPGRGRFRSLLLSALRHFLLDQHALAIADKRRGARATEDALEQLPDGSGTPEEVFTRVWLATVVAHALARLRTEWEQAGKGGFDAMSAMLLERGDTAELHRLAGATGVRANTLAVQAHRMRQRFRQLVRLELLQTVGSREALEQELAELRSVVPVEAAAPGPAQ